MPTETLSLGPVKETKATTSDAPEHLEDHEVRHRSTLNNNHVSQPGYNMPIGGVKSQDGVTNGTTLSSGPSGAGLGDRDYHHRQRQNRRRLKQKYRAKRYMVRWAKFMNSELKNNIVAVIGEFVGTTMFLFFAFAGTQLANVETNDTSIVTVTPEKTFDLAILFYISAAFGLSLMVNAWVFFRISGGLFNPAVTLALSLLGAIGPLRGVLLFIAQITGACFAAYLVSVMYPTPFNVQTTLGAGTTTAQGVWIEAMCTAMLVFTIVMLAMEKHRATFMAPIGIGMALFIGELVAVFYTGGSLNPARSFGPAAVTHDFHHNHWIYWVGPFIGTILAVSAYWLFKALEYEMANPGQDGDAENDPTQNRDHKMAQIVEGRKAEVEQIRAIEKEHGFDALNDVSAEGSVLGSQGVIGMAVEGVRDGDELHVQRVRKGEADLEANWPATQGVEAAQLDKKLSGSTKESRKTYFAGMFGSGKGSTSK